MLRHLQWARTLLPATAALVVLAGCSSSSNNKNKNNAATTAGSAATTAAQATAATTAATQAAAGTATRAAAVAPASPTVGAAATRAAGSPTAVRSATSAGAGAAVSPASGGPSDPVLQAALEKALLTDADLPAGFSSFNLGGGTSTVDLTQPGETAAATQIYLKPGTGAAASNPLSGQFIVVALGGFKDAKTATDGFKLLQSQALQSAGSDTKVDPVPNGPKIGDESLSYKLSGTSNGIDLNGYIITWRRGKVGGVVALIGTPAPKSVDDLIPIAQKQDAKLKAAGQ